MQKYFFVLGSHPLLSIAELNSKLNINKYQLIDNIFIVKLDKKIDLMNFIKTTGGIIKAGEIIKIIKINEIEHSIIGLINNIIPKKQKIIFGFSTFGEKIPVSNLAMNIKTQLKELGIKSRWINSKQKNLSSVIVYQNQMIDLEKKNRKGIEIIIIKKNNKIILGHTVAVQDFKSLSFRDYGRPARDDLSGMIPPKLAQIMLNLSKTTKKEKILDPFCGSGTILTEAMLMGYKKIIGTDISSKAIKDSQENIKWTQTKFNITTQPKLFQCDVKKLSKYLSNTDAIITEPYLGPQRGKINIAKTIKELEKLYSSALKEFSKILKPNKRIVMVWPVFCNKKQTIYINPYTNKWFKFVNPLPKKLKKHINRGLLYGRPQQRIKREIIILENKNPS